jgi:hypothetical protein
MVLTKLVVANYIDLSTILGTKLTHKQTNITRPTEGSQTYTHTLTYTNTYINTGG